jgi:hypothetical protein
MNWKMTTENKTYARQSIGRASRRVEHARDEGFGMNDDFGQVKPLSKAAVRARAFASASRASSVVAPWREARPYPWSRSRSSSSSSRAVL